MQLTPIYNTTPILWNGNIIHYLYYLMGIIPLVPNGNIIQHLYYEIEIIQYLYVM
jgi:hypothetical protein